MQVEPIVKTFFGLHIDLSKLVAVGDIETDPSFYSPSLTMFFQLMDKPIVHVFDSKHDFASRDEWIEYLQSKTNELIKTWETYASGTN